MSPPAFTAGLNGRLGTPPVEMICLDMVCARATVTAPVMRTATIPLVNVEDRRMCRSREVSAIVFLKRMIEKRRSKIQGWGVFATEAITKNTRIIDYAGEKISNQESLKRERRYIRSGPHLVLQAHQPDGDRRRRRRQRRALHQPLLPSQLLRPHRQRASIWIRAARSIRTR